MNEGVQAFPILSAPTFSVKLAVAFKLATREDIPNLSRSGLLVELMRMFRFSVFFIIGRKLLTVLSSRDDNINQRTSTLKTPYWVKQISIQPGNGSTPKVF